MDIKTARMSGSGHISLVRYFLVCGLDQDSGLEVNNDAKGAKDGNPLGKFYKSKILQYYPDVSTWSHFNPEAVTSLVLPQGLQFSVSKDRFGPPRCHPFVLTKEDGERSFGVSIVFCEPVMDINICHAFETLQQMYLNEVSSSVSGSTSQRSSQEGNRERPRNARVTSERSRSLPRHYRMSNLSVSTQDLNMGSYDHQKDTLYATKGVALILSEPLVSVAQHVLATIYKYINKPDFDVQVLEGLIGNLLCDIPLPNPGRSVRFWCLGEIVNLSMPKVPLELPLFDYDLFQLFVILGVQNTIKLWVCVLLENQVLVYSSEYDKLMLVCESITSLLYPFSWPHVYVPLLPPSLENFLDAPVPYIMGLVRRTHDIELSNHRGTVCILDIDNGELELPEELSEFPCEPELKKEIEDVIVEFGGREGARLLKEHAMEERDIAESSINRNVPLRTARSNSQHVVQDSSDTMAELNKMISKFEALSQQETKSSKTVGDAGSRLMLNNAIREVFVNRFAHLFLSYQHFVILPEAHEEDSSLESQTENFDKISFLSDQVQSHLPFLASFIETQMFTAFIDRTRQKGKSGFHVRLQALQNQYGECLVRTPTYKVATNIGATNEILRNRLRKVEVTVTPQKAKGGETNGRSTGSVCGIFPLLNPVKFTSSSNGSKRSTRRLVKGDSQSTSIDLTVQKLPMLNPSPASIAETHWKFVNQLLTECKQKTKRILLDKVGQEAVEWGHSGCLAVNVTGSEENMLVASVCDLIERIWSHGLRSRHRKSAFWNYLAKYGGKNEERMKFKGKLGNQAFFTPVIPHRKPFILPDHSRPVQVVSDPWVADDETFDSTVMTVMHNVSTVREIKSEIGYARAWIRLALERKSLSQYLHAMLSDETFLKTLYRRYAFVRCEDERQQSLFHLQTLNTVEFSCFTSAYHKSSILYQVLLFPSSKSSNFSTANVWMQIVGSKGESPDLQIPQGVLHFAFWTVNLGIITSLRLWHDNSGNSPNWLVEHVLVCNEFTGQIFKFSCGRWLGQGIDDGSSDRYMVGYHCQKSEDEGLPNLLAKLVRECSSPPETTCPAMQLKSTGARDQESSEVTAAEVVEIQTMLGDAINRIVKFYHRSLNEKTSYAHLMCGRFGLVHALIYIFSYGYKSARLFGKNLSVWDFFLKVTMDFNQSLQHLLSSPNPGSPVRSPIQKPGGTLESPRTSQRRMSVGAPASGSLVNMLLDSPRRLLPGQHGQAGAGINVTLSRANQFRRMYTRLITRIETSCQRLGKDDKFQLFVCLSVHDRLLGRIVTDLTRAVAAQHLYEEHAFLRDPSLTSFLSHILAALEDISVPVDPALKTTLEKH